LPSLLVLSKLTTIVEDVQAYCVEKPHSRVCETEADRIGFELMTLARCDASHAVENWRRMTAADAWRMPAVAASTIAKSSSASTATTASANGADGHVAATSEWDQSHPSHATRISDLIVLLSQPHIARLRSVHVDAEAVKRSARLLMPKAAIASFEKHMRAAVIEQERQRIVTEIAWQKVEAEARAKKSVQKFGCMFTG
jgi:hypothetical protein